MRSIIGVLGFLCVILLTILFGSPLRLFIDLPSLLFILGSIFFLGISKNSLKELQSLSDEVILPLIKCSLFCGGIGFLIGLIQIMNSENPTYIILEAMALCILPIFYSLVIATCLFAIKRGPKLRS